MTEADINIARTGLEADNAEMIKVYMAETGIETKIKELKDQMVALGQQILEASFDDFEDLGEFVGSTNEQKRLRRRFLYLKENLLAASNATRSMKSILSSNQNNIIALMSKYSSQKNNQLVKMRKIVAGYPCNIAIQAKLIIPS